MTTAHIDPAAIDALLAPFDRSDAPGFAVGVALGGRPGYRRGVGLASVELPITLSPSIRMRIGSTTKHFTVLAVMLLAEEGRVDIDVSPRKVLPELPAWADDMTIRQLMAHTSGMRDSLDLILHTAGPGVAAEPDYQVRMLAGFDSVNFAPGESWSYNNGGYVLLAEIVSRISGQSFGQVLREQIFEPVGMTDTMLRPLDTELIPNSATLHLRAPSGGWTRGVFGVPIGGEGGIVSTVDDMLRWMAHLTTPFVGTAATWTAMRTPATTHGYGLGITMGRHRGLSTLHHAGAVMGGSSQMLKVLDHDLDIIVMTNGLGSLEVFKLVDGIIDACVPDLPRMDTGAPLAPVRGTFYSKASGRKLVLDELDGDQTVRIDGMTLPARTDVEGRLSLPLVPTDLTITPHEHALEVTEFGQVDRLDRIVSPAEPDVSAILGVYDNPAAAIRAVIANREAATVLTIGGPLGASDYLLEPIGAEVWEGRASGSLPLAVLLEMTHDGFLLSTGRTRRLPFGRRR